MKNSLLIILFLGSCLPVFGQGQGKRFLPHIAFANSLALTPEILWWKMNEGNGSSVFTATVGPNGTHNQSSSYVTGANAVAQNALNFGGDTTCWSDTAVTYGANVITVCYWAYNTAWGVGVNVLLTSKSDRVTADTWRIENDEGLVNYIMQGTTVPNITRATLAAPSNNAWHHFAVIFNASTATGAITIYVDGALASPTMPDVAKDGTSNFGANALRVANLNGTSFWTGYMDDLRIYAYGLSAVQVSAVYANPQ